MKLIKIKNERGITISALVIMIIILIILAGISISMLTGENGIIAKARTTKETEIKDNYDKNIRLAITQVGSNYGAGTTEEEKLNAIKNILISDTELEAENIEECYSVVPKKLIIRTKEEYVYVVTAEDMISLGKHTGDIPLTVDIEKANIEYICTPSKLTNENVKIAIKINNKEYEQYGIQYQINDTSGQWTTYTNEIETEENCKIYVRLTDGLSVTDKYVSKNISNIDKLQPKMFEVGVVNTTNSIIISGETDDQEETDKYTKSGISQYYFSIDNGESWQTN